MPKVHGAVESERTASFERSGVPGSRGRLQSRACQPPERAQLVGAANRLSQVMGARLGMITHVEWQWFACKDLLPI